MGIIIKPHEFDINKGLVIYPNSNKNIITVQLNSIKKIIKVK